MEIGSIRCRDEICDGLKPGKALEAAAMLLASVIFGSG